MQHAIRFDDSLSIVLQVDGPDAGARIATIRQFLNYLNGQENIDVSSVSEQNRIVVAVVLALGRRWNVDFHLVWPEPRMNDQDFNCLKLMNWMASYGGSDAAHAFNPTSAEDARARACRRMQEVDNAYIASGTSTSGRIVLLNGGG